MQFGPDVEIPEDVAAMDIWAEVSSTDLDGLTVDGIIEGDIVEIQEISGICSFGKSNNKILAGFVGILGGILQDGASYYTKGQAKKTNEAIAEQTKILQDELSKDVKHKRRDGYGQDPGTDDFAKNEGGIIVCMPKAKGALYATKENYLADSSKRHGRYKMYFSNNIKRTNSFFPCRKEGGEMSATAETNGTLHLLAFDSKFKDNGGTYSVNVIITRDNPHLSHESAKRKLIEQRVS